jgi:SAM-dependent methyltransferase
MPVDNPTIEAYDRFPGRYAEEWLGQPPPMDLYRLLTQYFRSGPTADIGCGAGRDSAWLREQGFDVVGYDGSSGLLEEARRRYPAIEFFRAELPELDGVGHASFQNVLCETVIMHLVAADIPAAVRRLTELLRIDGTLYLSWRVTVGDDVRSDDERLYSAFPASLVLDALEDLTVVYDAEEKSESSGRTVHRTIARKIGD